MKQARLKIVVCAVAVLAIAGIGVLRVSYVHAAQRDLFDSTGSYFSGAQSMMLSSMTSGSSGRERAPYALPDQGEMLAMQNAVGIAGSAGALAAGSAVLAGCAVVGWAFGSLPPVVFTGLWGWAVNAAAVAAISQRGLSFALRLAPFPGASQPTLPSNSLAALFVAGLVSTFAWQTVVPAALGGLMGLRARAWRRSLVEIERYRDEPPVLTPPTAVPTSRKCVCGALNRFAQVTCYACGSPLTGQGIVTMSEE